MFRSSVKRLKPRRMFYPNVEHGMFVKIISTILEKFEKHIHGVNTRGLPDGSKSLISNILFDTP